jgi:two-component system phosphate regulon sensor histidine kinase PhoR
MTHELKTPIATISLAIDAMNSPLIKNDEGRYNEYTRILKEENKRLNTHVERVLQMAMLDKGELKLDKKELDPQVLIENAIATYQLQIKEKKAQFNFVKSEEAIKVMGDAFHLQNAFANLIDNALKYSAEHCRIDISVTKLQEEVYIHFVDNGIGIAVKDQLRVFDKFYRVQGGNLHDVKGFGLGLSYVKSIVEAHGGRIELKSEKDKGSVFVLRFKSA